MKDIIIEEIPLFVFMLQHLEKTWEGGKEYFFIILNQEGFSLLRQTEIILRGISDLEYIKKENGIFFKEEYDMATKPITFVRQMLPVIPADKSVEFLKKANQNVLSAEYLKECSKSAKKFKEK